MIKDLYIGRIIYIVRSTITEHTITKLQISSEDNKKVFIDRDLYYKNGKFYIFSNYKSDELVQVFLDENEAIKYHNKENIDHCVRDIKFYENKIKKLRTSILKSQVILNDLK